MTLYMLVSSIILSAGSLAYGFTDAGYSSAARWAVLIGILWIVSQVARWRWFSSAGLVASVLFAALGLWYQLNFGWMLAGALFALFAWDMADFRYRMIAVAVDDDTRALERRHIAKVSLLCLAGLGLASLAMYTQLQFTFEWGVFLVIVVLIGLAQLIGWFRRQ